jgi:hypothetical protein
MSGSSQPPTCPACDEPLDYAFMDTSGLGGQKRGDAYNTVPDSAHYVCFACASAWKQRADGPLTPDAIGEIAFFTCRAPDCGRPLVVTSGTDAMSVELECGDRHRFFLARTDDGELAIRRQPGT